MSVITVPHGATDRADIQDALDTCGTYGVVVLEESTYDIDGPLFIPNGAILLTGRYSSAQTILNCTGSQFPAIVRVPPTSMAAPVDGDELILDGALTKWLNLSADCWLAQSLSDIAPWTCSFDLKLSTLHSDERTIIASQGYLGTGPETNTMAFSINTFDGKIRLQWGWGGGGQLTSAVLITVNVWHTVLITFSGTLASITIDTVMVASVAAGPIQQSFHEDVCVGCSPVRWPDGSAATNAPVGRIRNIHMVGSGTSPGTTTDIHPVFEEADGPMIPIDTGVSRHWTVYRVAGVIDFCPVYLRHFTVQGGTGIFANNAVGSLVDDVITYPTYNGFYFWDNCFKSVLRNIRATGGRFGIAFVGTANTLSLVDNFQAQDSIVGVCVSDGGGAFRNGFMYGNKVTFIIKGDFVNGLLDNLSWGDEAMPPPGPAYGVYASHCRGLKITFCTSAFLLYPTPGVTLDDCTGVVIDNMEFGAASGIACLVDASTSTEPPIIMAPAFVDAFSAAAPLLLWNGANFSRGWVQTARAQAD